ncbi:hypothetical protein [Chlorogloea sp. CCALA 695]|nr:hypothetical protein [Chlorogloea sp. CCALA 695]
MHQSHCRHRDRQAATTFTDDKDSLDIYNFLCQLLDCWISDRLSSSR